MEQQDQLFYRQIERNFIAYASGREDIRAAFVIGSRARTDHPADQWSDMDIVFYTTNPGYYLEQQDWLNKIGDVLCTCVFQSAGGDSERLNLFCGGWQVDFVVHSFDDLCEIAARKAIPKNFLRGVRPLIDKDNLAKAIMPDQFQLPESQPITNAAFLQATNLFWFASLYIAKQLLRGELWVAKMREYDIKVLLLQMIEWHEKAVSGCTDTWHAGRFMNEWVSKGTLDKLSESFGRYNQADTWNALVATTELFLRLSKDVGQKMQYTCPAALESYVSEWIKEKAGTVE